MTILRITSLAGARSWHSGITSKIGITPECCQLRFRVPEIKRHGGLNYWPKWSVIRDQKKRMCVKEFGITRLRINALRKNDILPPELQEIADVEIAAEPHNSSTQMTVPRCSLTGRGHGCVQRWRLGRHVFRHLADYNKLSGVQRAMW